MYSLYTYDCPSHYKHNRIFKFADDTTILGLIKGSDESQYQHLVANTISYGEENNLLLTTTKTKKILSQRKQAPPPQPLLIRGTEVEWVDGFTFLGLYIANDLTWSNNTTAIIKKDQQCLYITRSLKKASLIHKPLTQAFRGLVGSILTRGITVFWERKALQIIRTAERLIGSYLPSIDTLITHHQQNNARAIPSQRASKLAHHKRHHNSFFPAFSRWINEDIQARERYPLPLTSSVLFVVINFS